MPSFGQLLELGKGALVGSKYVEKDESPRDRRHGRDRSGHRKHPESRKRHSKAIVKSRHRKMVYDPSSTSSESSSSDISLSSQKPAKPKNVGQVIVHAGSNRMKDRSKMVVYGLGGYGLSRLAQGGRRGADDHGTLAELKKRHKLSDEIEGFGAAVIGATAVHIIKQLGSRFRGDSEKELRKRHRAGMKRKHESRSRKGRWGA